MAGLNGCGVSDRVTWFGSTTWGCLDCSVMVSYPSGPRPGCFRGLREAQPVKVRPKTRTGAWSHQGRDAIVEEKRFMGLSSGAWVEGGRFSLASARCSCRTGMRPEWVLYRNRPDPGPRRGDLPGPWAERRGGTSVEGHDFHALSNVLISTSLG